MACEYSLRPRSRSRSRPSSSSLSLVSPLRGFSIQRGTNARERSTVGWSSTSAARHPADRPLIARPSLQWGLLLVRACAGTEQSSGRVVDGGRSTTGSSIRLAPLAGAAGLLLHARQWHAGLHADDRGPSAAVGLLCFRLRRCDGRVARRGGRIARPSPISIGQTVPNGSRDPRAVPRRVASRSSCGRHRGMSGHGRDAQVRNRAFGSRFR